MKKLTRQKFNHATGSVASLNGIDNAAVKFAVEPSVAQKMVDTLQESSEFLQKINIHPVDELEGDTIGLTQGSTIAGRSNTKGGNKRTPVDPTGLKSNTYKCHKTDFDVAIRYEKMDAWAKFPDFYARWKKFVDRAIALDMIMIGWNGTSAAVDTDRAANPLLQDVNIGWLEQIRTKAPERYMKEVVEASGKVKIGATGDYNNLDALVTDVVSNLISEIHQDDTDLVVICGRQLLNDKNFPLVNNSKDNTDALAGQILLSQKQIGGLTAVRVPFFPENALLVTSLDNLSIYFQESGKRRQIIDRSELDQVEEYQSSNDAYVIENYEKVGFVENIEIL
ncbi:phage major capsid protein, P2 family [Acinetobacter baumannii]|uniref:phage major capsid protein, P2 family n=1 Tax=Acinetobacter calcoaceticus/baumannii complex TaxID=909768 RepID=UPI0002CF2ACF|nr:MULTISPECIES: phage major capsid protein, P2 family [Acinetobacter calcoaceticus/baumannii complex]ENU11097.1 P2 family phage major capsid protein [Acinetobacter calcoaceticus NIPH 13]MBJ9442934.1 phage major capsid protein, P2 family [Acinetobacter baumannii]MCZ3042515.1 phage major capsid protein, P2 family [Acinetobacter baumannii]MDA3360806.1 phage major capsid protein, P2 family [Acinetobacter baumannii]MDN8137325.1 phage major capsid protein, P2 family [Acinetobacter baumannii]